MSAIVTQYVCFDTSWIQHCISPRWGLGPFHNKDAILLAKEFPLYEKACNYDRNPMPGDTVFILKCCPRDEHMRRWNVS